MGHIRKQGKNSYQVVVSEGRDPVTGKYKYIYKTVKGNKTDAKKVMHQLEYEIENGTYIEPSKLSLAELLNKWYKDYCEINLAESTQEYYDIIINTHIIPLLGSINLSDLKPMHIQSYLSKKLKNGRMDGKKGGLSKKSVKRHYTVLNQVLKYAVKLQIIDTNPADPISPPSPDKPEIQAMTQKEVNILLEAADGWLYDFLYLAVFTGMRRGELLALRWKDVDFKNKKIHVRPLALHC
ncbi:tyrosine recombinase XerC [Natroniella sp. ANB-PHB2]|uniref:site-specific integrase n=1 Tax=Natroniella sp. ANB-PHB2 TaxID=3384444 RepID=UPI0038D4E5DD